MPRKVERFVFIGIRGFLKNGYIVGATFVHITVPVSYTHLEYSVEQALSGGATMIQLRDKQVDFDTLCKEDAPRFPLIA